MIRTDDLPRDLFRRRWSFGKMWQGAATKTFAPEIVTCPDCFIAKNVRSVHVNLFR